MPSGTEATRDLLRRCALTTTVVSLWMAAGFLLHLDALPYMFMGVPIALAMQRFVCRRPLLELWVFHRHPLRLGRKFAVITALAAIVPLLCTARALTHGVLLPELAWEVLSVFGAVGIGVAICAQRLSALRGLWSVLVGGTVAGMLMFGLRPLLLHGAHLPSPAGVVEFGAATAQYLAIAFVLEEVVFRGLFDRYLVGDSGQVRAQAATMLLCSGLWGAWHLPMVAQAGHLDGGTVFRVLMAQVGLGAVLTHLSRRSGTLVASAFVHAVVDAFRDGLL